ncbi:unnamed protein product [Rhodiola kirilowii]
MDMTGAAAALNRVPPCMMIKSQSSLGAGNRIAIESRTCLKIRIELESGFRDVSHVLYYQTRPTTMMRREKATTAMMANCGGVATDKKMKKDEKKKMKKLKLLKELTKDLSMFSQVGLVGEDNVGGISEAAETLMKHLQEMKSKEKELKKKRKMEKAMMKAAAANSSSSSESESSDSECGKVVDVASLRMSSSTQSSAQKDHSKIDSCPALQSIAANLTQDNPFENLDLCKPVTVAETATKKIEVCMGGKCKKSGAAQLVEEFEKVVGEGVAVVGCKCMGKCRDGPNVRVLSCSSGADASNLSKIDASLSSLPLCIGVGLEDVGVIVANFLGRGVSSSSSSQANLAVVAT